MTVPSSPFGRPLEDFLLDPQIKWDGPQLRAPMEVPDSENTYHILLGIGQRYYPYFPDFFEEAKVMGVSKRIPRTFIPTKLKEGKSRFLLVHPIGIPEFTYQLEPRQDHLETQHDFDLEERCVRDLWPLSAAGKSSNLHKILQPHPLTEEKDMAKIETPSVTYFVKYPKRCKPKKMEYTSALVLSFSTFGFEYVNQNGTLPKQIKDNFSTTTFKLDVVPL